MMLISSVVPLMVLNINHNKILTIAFEEKLFLFLYINVYDVTSILRMYRKLFEDSMYCKSTKEDKMV